MTERKKNILILTITILVSLVAIEGVLRFFEKDNYVALWLINKDGMGIYRPNTDKYFLDNEDYKKYHIKRLLGFLNNLLSEPLDPLEKKKILINIKMLEQGKIPKYLFGNMFNQHGPMDVPGPKQIIIDHSSPSMMGLDGFEWDNRRHQGIDSYKNLLPL